MSLQPEQIEQINLYNWFCENYPNDHEDFYHFANERKCSIQTGRTLKRMGVKAGVADIFIAIPKNDKNGLWIELKVGSNKPSEAQTNFIARMKMRGFEACCVWGKDEAKLVIDHYMNSFSHGKCLC